jgi:exonuclease III
MYNSFSLPVLKFPHITSAAQNCNSLNISTECDKQLTKIVAITSLCTNVIFLSDIRMGCSSEHSEKISKMFLTNSTKKYQFIFNSSKSSRGVGMLIDSSLLSTVLSIYKCPTENILGVRLLLDNSPILLISIYGPNDNDISFYSSLSALLAENSDVPVIVGGDWNSTYSTSDPNKNPDVLYMKTIPSKLRSGWLNDLCIEFKLSDPFRAFHPTRRDFTFTPRGNKKNRSRLDFFLISNCILSFVQRCEIASSISISLFDHKPIFLDFTKNKTNSKLFINRTILNNPRTDDVVLAAVADTYLSHAAAAQPPGVLEDDYVFHPSDRDPLTSQKLEVGKFIKLCKDYNALIERKVNEKNNNLLSLLIAEKETEINLQHVKIWDVERYSKILLNCSNDYFFEALASNIKGQVISFQTWVKKVENMEKSSIITLLNKLKVDYIANTDAISKLEAQLNAIIDSETLLKVKSMKLFSCLNAEKPTPIFLSLARSSNASTNLACIRKRISL